MIAEKLLDAIRNNDAEFVDFRFTDMRGVWHHMSISVDVINEDFIKEGIYFDGSSIPGWRSIHESDMVLMADLEHIILDPFTSLPTLIVFCDVFDPVTQQPYNRDPRTIARRAEQHLIETGLGDKAFFGPEAEFFIFDAVRHDTNQTRSFFELASDEFPCSNSNSLESGNHGHRAQCKGAYFPVSPLDSMLDLRAEMTTVLKDFGVSIEKHHHEVAPAQHEIGVHFAELVRSADIQQIYKYVVKNVAHGYGKTATFMPKPVYGDNGSGMHVHQSLWLKNKPLFAGEGYAGLSDTALHYIGGILKHARALNAFTNPTTNSYKRLVPGFEAPVILTYSARNRSAACRIPISHGDKARRAEIRFPDPAANSYLAFAAMLMAGLDGIQSKTHPGEAMDIDLFENKEVASKLPTVCSSLRQALEHLEQDHLFLLKGGVFTNDFLKAYMDVKWQEVYQFEHSPHPIEFKMYYSV